MDVDDNPRKDEGAEGCNMNDEPSSHNKHIPNWTGYNVQTPDLNMLLHNEDDAGPSTSYYQPSPYPFDEPASPEFVSAQAPATPGLMEETVPSRVHESPVLSPQRKASPSSNEETAKADSFAAPPSEFLQSAAPNANDAVGAETIDFGLSKPVQVESSGAVHDMDSPRQHFSAEVLPPVPQTSNLEATVDKLVLNNDDIAVSGETLTLKATMEGVPFVQNTSEPSPNGPTEPFMIENPTQFNKGSVDVQEYNMPTMGGGPFVQNTSEPCTNGSTEPCVIGNPTHFNDGSVNVQGYNMLASNISIEQNLQGIPPEMPHSNISVADFQQNTGTMFQQNAGSMFQQNAGTMFQQSAGTMFPQNAGTMFPQNSGTMFPQNAGTMFPQNAGTMFPQNAGTIFPQNAGTMFPQNAGTIFPQNAGTIFPQNTGAVLQQNAGTVFQQNAGTVFQQNAGTVFQQNAGAVFQQNAGTIPQYMSYNHRPNDLSTSNFLERETMLSAPDTQFHLTNDLGQITAERGITESDGSNKIGSLTSRKRHLEDSLPAPQSRTTENLPSRPHGKRPADAIPDDDDLLASILVGRRTPGLTLDSTPLPPNASSLKRQRLTPKTVTPKTTPKRRVKMDDAMVIHADIIRQQLISTEDIRRIRRKAPCTRSEIWMIEKGSLEDDIFREPIFSCMRKDLNKLQYRTYEIVPHPTVHNMELQGQLDMSETIAVDTENVSISGANESAALDHQFHMVLPDGAQLDALPQKATDTVDATPRKATDTIDAMPQEVTDAVDAMPQEATNIVDAMPQEATDTVDATSVFGLQIPSDEHANNIEKVTESLFGDEREISLVDETNADTNIPAQDDTLDKVCLQDASVDLQRNTDTHLVLDDITHDSATRIADAPDIVLDSSSPTLHKQLMI